MTDTVYRGRDGLMRTGKQLIGNEEPNCPYCGIPLTEKNYRKKCPSCGGFIHYRKRPFDEKSVLLTDEECQTVKEQWAILNGTHPQFLKQKEEMTTIKSELADKIGSEPSIEDVEWVRLNRRLTSDAENNNWGSYWATRQQMAEILRKSNKMIDALNTYLEVCYLDLNGPINYGIVEAIKPNQKNKFFKPERKLLVSPYLIQRIHQCNKTQKLSHEQMRNTFLHIAEKQQKNLQLPINPLRAWEVFEKAYYTKHQI